MGGDYSPAVAAIGAVLLAAIGLIAARGEHWNRTRVRRTTADGQDLNACIRRHPSRRPAHIPSQRRPS